MYVAVSRTQLLPLDWEPSTWVEYRLSRSGRYSRPCELIGFFQGSLDGHRTHVAVLSIPTGMKLYSTNPLVAFDCLWWPLASCRLMCRVISRVIVREVCTTVHKGLCTSLGAGECGSDELSKLSRRSLCVRVESAETNQIMI